MDHSPPASSVHGIFKTRILAGVAISFSNAISTLQLDKHWWRQWDSVGKSKKGCSHVAFQLGPISCSIPYSWRKSANLEVGKTETGKVGTGRSWGTTCHPGSVNFVMYVKAVRVQGEWYAGEQHGHTCCRKITWRAEATGLGRGSLQVKINSETV